MLLIKPGFSQTPVNVEMDDDDESFDTVNALLDLVR